MEAAEGRAAAGRRAIPRAPRVVPAAVAAARKGQATDSPDGAPAKAQKRQPRQQAVDAAAAAAAAKQPSLLRVRWLQLSVGDGAEEAGEEGEQEEDNVVCTKCFRKGTAYRMLLCDGEGAAWHSTRIAAIHHC